MNVTIETRHMSLPEDIREYTHTKAEKLSKFFDRIKSVEVILDHEANCCKTEIIAHINKKPPVVATHSDEDLRTSIDKCMDKVSQQVKKLKEILKDHKESDDR